MPKFNTRAGASDELMIKSLVDYFGYGKAYTYKNYTEYKSCGLADNFEKIISFFQKYPIIGVKALDFTSWCKVTFLPFGLAQDLSPVP